MENKIKEAIELLNRNGYVVTKVSKAQMTLAENCKHDNKRCAFNLFGVKCLDLICARELIKEQILPYIDESKAKE